MRIRSIRPEFWSSEDIAALDWNTRLIFIGLWSYVDDNGVGRDVPKLITADLFPLEDDPHGALMQVTGALKTLVERELITRYTVDKKPYLHITTWDTHQKINRPSGERYPLPTCGNAVFETSLSEPSVSPHAKSTVGEGEKGRRGEGEKSSSSGIADALPDTQRREDVDRLCDRLAEHIEANGGKRPNITKGWRDAARLLIDRDGYTEQQVAWMIDWCQRDEFWHSNILSMPKLREKFDQMRMKARPTTGQQGLRLAANGEPIISMTDDRR